ncbi:DUF922 domain-containing protein (plasmid) [Mesorhizobium atlanticum]|uniref:DUF922 domain-containing protein n=1 Tax=Mesorhizobium atlanticum TaxID=2233532 RepID=UPI0037038713
MPIGLVALTFACGARAEVKEVPLSGDDETRVLSPAEPLNRNALRSGAQNASEGEASDHLVWTFQFRADGGSCKLVSDTVVVKIARRRAPWADRPLAEPKVRAAWKAYYDGLRAHEQVHSNIAVAAAHKVDAAIHGAEGPRTCREVEATLDRDVRQIEESEEKRQAQWDEENMPSNIP